MTRFTAMIYALLGASTVFATERDQSLSAWYDALEKGNVPALEGLMAPDEISDFKYIASDFGLEKNRSGFIAFMTEWAANIQYSSIDYKITHGFEGGYTALVCYRFETSEFLAEESVGVYDGLITFVEQSGKGNSCPNF